MEQRGKFISSLCIVLVVTVVVSILYFAASKGPATFFKDKINVFDFLSEANWNPSDIGADDKSTVGTLPMITGSFIITFLSAIVTTSLTIGAVAFMTEISPKKGTKFLQPVIELFVGIPPVVHGLIGLSVIIPSVHSIFGGAGLGVLAGTLVLFVMILPAVTTVTIDTLKAALRHYREAPLALGAARWQMIYKVVLRVAMPGILTAAILDITRAFGETLTIRMVIGNVTVMPTSLTTPASTLTSVLAMGIRNTIMGTVENNVPWSLALILLLMPLLFSIATRIIGKRGALK